MTSEQQRVFWLRQIDAVFKENEALRERDINTIQPQEWIQLWTRARAAIGRIAPGSHYENQCDDFLKRHTTQAGTTASNVLGVLRALRCDVDAGFLDGLTERIHGELFADFLEMSQHLLDEGMKDAAAVIAGSSLEEQLRQMCKKAGIDVTYQGRDGEALPKKASVLNADLGKAEAHSKLDEQSVTAWLALRNKAAHGQYEWYVIDQVRLMVDGVRDYIRRHPA